MNPFDTPEQPRERITRKHVTAVVIMAILIMLPFAGLIYKQRADEAAKAEAARVANIQKEETKKVLAALKQDYPRRPELKEKKMAVKIARGTTGQADFIETLCGSSIVTEEAGCTQGWSINGPEIISNYSQIYDGSECRAGDGYTGNPGWDVSPTGVITVPPEATPGNYTARYLSGETCEDTSGTGTGEGSVINRYQFQVTCTKVTIIGLTPVTP